MYQVEYKSKKENTVRSYIVDVCNKTLAKEKLAEWAKDKNLGKLEIIEVIKL